MSRHGSIESHQVYCQYKINCKFNITIKKDMMPEAKVVIYYVKDRKNMYQGETTIVTTELGRNTVSCYWYYSQSLHVSFNSIK